MNTLLLGNGFDLYHNLPTTYSCFLNVIKAIIYYRYDSQDISLLNVLKRVNNPPKEITNAYNTYTDIYENNKIDNDYVRALFTSQNCWLKYMLDAYDKNVGWIDFEIEISRVIEEFNRFINIKELTYITNAMVCIHSFNLSTSILYFNFFFDVRRINQRENYVIKREYLKYSNNGYILNVEKVVDELYNQLLEFDEILVKYLELFVETVYAELDKKNIFDEYDQILTFNYTKTFEKIYGNDVSVCHIHGDLDSQIILGINSDMYDYGVNKDLTFINFKKYYQRVVYGTNDEYLKELRRTLSTMSLKVNLDASFLYDDGNKPNDTYKLSVCGHSLDCNDKDVIKDFFEKATHIIIYYHDERTKIQYYQNLIMMFDKDGFDKLFREKFLEFKPINELFKESD